jgi:hypothetical protein
MADDVEDRFKNGLDLEGLAYGAPNVNIVGRNNREGFQDHRPDNKNPQKPVPFYPLHALPHYETRAPVHFSKPVHYDHAAL